MAGTRTDEFAGTHGRDAIRRVACWRTQAVTRTSGGRQVKVTRPGLFRRFPPSHDPGLDTQIEEVVVLDRSPGAFSKLIPIAVDPVLYGSTS
jgi:hypothetical protein